MQIAVYFFCRLLSAACYLNMPKLKTHKATAKRIIITKTKKIKHRKCGQDHFNARESGNTVRNKRRDISTSKSIIRTIRELTPYN